MLCNLEGVLLKLLGKGYDGGVNRGRGVDIAVLKPMRTDAQPVNEVCSAEAPSPLTGQLAKQHDARHEVWKNMSRRGERRGSILG